MAFRRRSVPHIPEIAGLSQLRPVASGGFATVYSARQEALGRTVAVKVLHNRHPDAASLRRFHEECRAAGSLSLHPHVVPVYDSGFEDGVGPYLVMEFMPGGTLRDRMAKGLTTTEATNIAVDLAGALDAAHVSGVVHGDVKPENVLFDAFGRPRLADFGISSTGLHTTVGTVAATICYAAPEILSGQAASSASDVFALACVTVEMLQDRHPFVTPDMAPAAAVAAMLRATAPDLTAIGVTPALDAAIRSGLEGDPEIRPTTGGLFGGRLHEAATASGLAVHPLVTGPVRNAGDRLPDHETVVVHQKRRPPLRVAVAVAVVVALVVTAAIVRRGGSEGDTAAAVAAQAGPPAQDEDGIFTFAFPTAEASNVRAARTWTLDVDKRTLVNELTVTNTSPDAQRAVFFEVIPKQVAADVKQVTFDPEPTDVVKADPVVRYELDLDGSGNETLRWEVEVGEDVDDGRLVELADARDQAEAAYFASIAQVGTEPAVGGVEPGEVTTTTTGGGGQPTTSTSATKTTTRRPTGPTSDDGGDRVVVVPTTNPPGPTAPAPVEPEPASTTTPAPTQPGTRIDPPGDVASLVVRDPIPEEFVDGIPQKVRLTVQWSRPSDDGGQAPSSYRLKCTVMQRDAAYGGTANSPCKGGTIVASPSGSATSTTIVIGRSDAELSWIKWELAAVNDGGTGSFRVAQVVVPNVIGTFSWEAFPVGRAIGLMVGGDAAYDCGQGRYTICRQSQTAGSTRASGVLFALASNT